MKKKPQKGNPHELTLKQHCFPRRSIERFANQDGIVHVWLKEQGKSIPARPEDQVFCARWVWDQRAEDGFMREVEDAYEALAEEIVQGRIVRRLRPGENNAVTEMYALWLVRSKWRGSPLEDQPLENVIGLAHEFSQDEREGLEKIGVAVVGPDFKLKGRHIASGVAQLDFFRLRSGLKQQRWAVLKTVGTEFVVPDVSDQPVLPLTPELCLVPGEGYRIAEHSRVSAMNARAVRESERYFFAKSPVNASGVERLPFA